MPATYRPVVRQNKGKELVWKLATPKATNNNVSAGASALLGAATCLFTAAAAADHLVKERFEDGSTGASDNESTETGEDTCSAADESDSGTTEDASRQSSAGAVESKATTTAVFSRASLLRARRYVVSDCELSSGRLRTAVRPPGPPDSSPTAGPTTPTAKSPAALVAAPSPTSWAAGRRLRQKESLGDEHRGEGDDFNVAVRRSVKSILNKLTVEKFETLYEKLLECGIQTAEDAELLAQEIFEKATLQHNFAGMYADLCSRLLFDLADVSPQLQYALLQHCEIIFRSSLSPADTKEENSGDNDAGGDEEEKQALRRKRMLGNARFLGQLFVRRVAPSDILFAYCDELLETHQNEHIEILAAILTVVGPVFDSTEWFEHEQLCFVFSQLRGLQFDPTVPPRVKCRIRDVFDLRDSGWVDTKQALLAEAPKRLEEVKAEASGKSPTKQALMVEAPKHLQEVKAEASGKPATQSGSSLTPLGEDWQQYGNVYGEDWQQYMPQMVCVPMVWVPMMMPPVSGSTEMPATLQKDTLKPASPATPPEPPQRKSTRLVNRRVAA